MATTNENKNVTDTEETSHLHTNSTIEFFYFYEVEQFTVLWILFVVIVAGNSGVLYTLTCGRSRKSRMSYFMAHLAFADLCVGLICVLTDIAWKITVSWTAGNIACKGIRFLQVVVTYSSTYVLVALTIDRYDAIRHPMRFSGSSDANEIFFTSTLEGMSMASYLNGGMNVQSLLNCRMLKNKMDLSEILAKNGRRAKCLILTAWLFSVTFSTPILIFYEEKEIQGRPQCWIEFDQPWKWKVYITLVSLSLFVLPTIIIAWCYAVIIITIWSKSMSVGFPATNNKKSTPTTPSSNNAVNGNKPQNKIVETITTNDRRIGSDCSKRASSRGLIPRAKIKTVKITFVIVSVFIMCWSPYIIFDLLQVYGHIPHTQTNISIATFVQSLAPLNSAANPIIYCLFSTHFCRTLWLLPPFKWFCNESRRRAESTTNTQSSSLSQFHTNTHKRRMEASGAMNTHAVSVH